MADREDFFLYEDREDTPDPVEQFTYDWGNPSTPYNDRAWAHQQAAKYAMEAAPSPTTPRDIFGSMDIHAARDHFEPAVANEFKLRDYAKDIETLVSATGSPVEIVPWLMDLPEEDVKLLVEGELLSPGITEELVGLQQAQAYAAAERQAIMEMAEKRADEMTRRLWEDILTNLAGGQAEGRTSAQDERAEELLNDPAFIEQVRDDFYAGISTDTRVMIEDLWNEYIGDDGEVLMDTVLNQRTFDELGWSGREVRANHWVVENLLNSPLFADLDDDPTVPISEKIEALHPVQQEAFWEEAKLIMERAVLDRLQNPDYTTTDIKQGGTIWNSFWRGVSRKVVGPAISMTAAGLETVLTARSVETAMTTPTYNVESVNLTPFKDLHEGQLATQIELTTQAREDLREQKEDLGELTSEDLNAAFRSTMTIELHSIWRNMLDTGDATAEDFVLAAGGDEDVAFALWQSSINEQMDDDAKRQVLESVIDAEDAQLVDFTRMLEESDYQPGTQLLQWLAAYDQWVMATPTAAMLLMAGDENQWLPEDVDTWSEAREFAKIEYDNSPARVLGWEGTMTGIFTDVGLGTVSDPLTFLTTPGGAAGAKAASKASVKALVAKPFAQRVIREGAEKLISGLDEAALRETGALSSHALPVIQWMPEHVRASLLDDLVDLGTDQLDEVTARVTQAFEESYLAGKTYPGLSQASFSRNFGNAVSEIAEKEGPDGFVDLFEDRLTLRGLPVHGPTARERMSQTIDELFYWDHELAAEAQQELLSIYDEMGAIELVRSRSSQTVQAMDDVLGGDSLAWRSLKAVIARGNYNREVGEEVVERILRGEDPFPDAPGTGVVVPDRFDPKTGTGTRVIRSLEELEEWASTYDLGGRLQDFWDRWYDTYNHHMILNGKHGAKWRETGGVVISPHTGEEIVDWGVIQGRDADELIGGRRSAATTVQQQFANSLERRLREVAAEQGIDLGDEAAPIIYQMLEGDAPLADAMVRATNSGYNRTPNVQFPVSPFELVGLSRFNPSQAAHMNVLRGLKVVYNLFHKAFVLDKVVTPRTGVVVAFDEWLSSFLHFGSVESFIEYSRMTAEAVTARAIKGTGAGRLTQRQRELINTAHRVPSIQNRLEAFNTPGRGAPRQTLTPKDPGFERAATEWVTKHLEDLAWRAYYTMSRDEWIAWFNNSDEAAGIQRVMNASLDEATEAGVTPRRVTGEEAYELLDLTFNELYFPGTTKADRKALLDHLAEGARRTEAAEQWTPDPAVIDSMPSVMGTSRKVDPLTDPLGSVTDFFLRHFFENPMNKRRTFIWRMVDKIERRRLEKLFADQGYEIMEWADISRLLGMEVAGSPAMRRQLAEELLRNPLPDGRKVLPRTYIDDLVERTANQKMDELMYKWHTSSRAEQGLRPVFPFVGPFSDMWARWGRKLFNERTNWRWLSNVDNPNRFQKWADRALGTLPVNLRTWSRLSRIANTNLEAFNMDEDPLFGGLGFEELDFTPIMFLPTEGNDPWATMIPGFGPAPLILGDAVIQALSKGDPSRHKEIAEWAGNFSTFLRFSRFGGVTNNAVNRFVGNGNLHRTVSVINDVSTFVRGMRGEGAVAPESSPLPRFYGDISLQTLHTQHLMERMAADGGDELFEMLFDQNLTAGQAWRIMEGFANEAMIESSLEHLGDVTLRGLVPVNAEVYGVADQVTEAWNNVAASNPDLFPDAQVPEGADDNLRDVQGAKARGVFWELPDTTQDLLLVQNPELVVNMVSRWEWTQKAEQEIPDRALFRYRTDGTPESLDEHRAFIENGYIVPKATSVLVREMAGRLGSAYRNTADDVWEMTFANINRDYWDNHAPEQWHERFDDHFEAVGEDWGVEDPFELWVAWSSLSDDIRERLLLDDEEFQALARERVDKINPRAGGHLWSDLPEAAREVFHEEMTYMPRSVWALSTTFSDESELDTAPSPNSLETLHRRLDSMGVEFDKSLDPQMVDQTNLRQWLPENYTLYEDVLGLDLTDPSYTSLWYDTHEKRNSLGYFASLMREFHQEQQTDASWNAVLGNMNLPADVARTMEDFEHHLFLLDRRASAEGGRRITSSEQEIVRNKYQQVMLQFGWDGESEEFTSMGLDFMDYWDRNFYRQYGDLDWEVPDPRDTAPLFDDDGNLNDDAVLPLDIQVIDGDSLAAKITDRSYPVGTPLNRLSNHARPQGVFQFRLLGVLAADYGRSEDQTQRAREHEDRLSRTLKEAEAAGKPVYLVFDKDFAGSRVDAFGRGLVWLYIGDEPYQMEDPAEGYIPRNR